MLRIARGTVRDCVVHIHSQCTRLSHDIISCNASTLEAACSTSGRNNVTSATSNSPSRRYLHTGSCCSSSSTLIPKSAGKNQKSSSSSAAFVFALPCLFTAFLGTWQIVRRHSKIELVEARTAALKGTGVELNELSVKPAEFTRVHIQGEFDHERSIYVGPRPRSSMGSAINGFMLVTPLHSDDWNRPVLVNRGWVPSTWRSDAQFRQQWDTSGTVSLEAVTRVSEDPSSFVPQNNPKTGEWFWIDIPAMAAALGLPADTPLVEAVSVAGEQPASSGSPTTMDVMGLRTTRPLNEESYPITRSVSELMTFKVTPNDHRNYALTWYTLSAATGSMAYGILNKRKGR
ncbi:hypothetical protein WJX79_003765 [Trebouxia sp. C0005]|nr:MAG: Surfeit locus 1 cytochrome c oxidase biogenesis isoform 1 [Trebouxia sp. A1-2]